MHAMSADMSGKHAPKQTRQMIAIPAELAPEIKEVAKKVGCPSITFLATAGLRHIVKQINSGELSMINGQLCPSHPKAA